MRIEAVDDHGAETYSDVVGRGFNDGQPTPPAFRDLAPVSLATPRGTSFLATVDGEPAGGGRVSWADVPRERGGGRVALLAGGSTRPEFRRRGVHAALLEARVAQAIAASCDTACVLCGPDTASERNVARAGFTHRYTRDLLVFG
jgi:GNAT superfamily N-acetyltransferase